MEKGDHIADSEMMANNLINLKCIHLNEASIDTIMPFIRQSVKMQRIKVDWFGGGVHFNRNTGTINLLALNREHKKLPDSQKITIYVDEEIYLSTKWAMREIDFELQFL